MQIGLNISRDQRSLIFNWNESNHIPNVVPIEIGANVSSGFMLIAHMLKASTGTSGRSTTNVGSTKKDTRNVVNLANARIPKYTMNVLFLRVIAYSLGRNRIGWLSGTGEGTTHLNVMKMSEKNKKKAIKTI